MNCLCPEPIGHRDAPQTCEWRRITAPRFEGRYWVSSDGDVWGTTGLMAQSLKNGFKAVCLSRTDGDGTGSFHVHRLVARAFLPDYAKGRQIRFHDGDKWNCRADNLRWHEAATYETIFGPAAGRKEARETLRQIRAS
jgi:hypothetical protein